MATRAKMSLAQRGHPVSAETRARIAAAVTGKGIGNTRVIDAPVKGNCVYCFEPAQTHDHVIPRGRTGWDEPSNVVLACISCNASKKDRTPEEWFADL